MSKVLIRPPLRGRTIRILPEGVGAAARRLNAAEAQYRSAAAELKAAREAWMAVMPAMHRAGIEAIAEARSAERRPAREEEGL